MKKFALSTLFLALGASTTAFSANDNIVISGTIPSYVTIHQTDNNGHILNSAPVIKKPIQLEHVILSAAAKKYLAEHIGHENKKLLTNNMLPPQVELDMNNVPVLDQGQHGTCATFATTASLDALLGHTDYISQLCNLELGAYLAKDDADYPSGWDGSTGEIVLGQIQKYGIITQAFQNQKGCAKVRSYPLSNEFNTGKPMKTSDFVKNSKKIMDNLSWKTLLEYSDALSPDAQMEEAFSNVKQALSNGHRIVIGTLIDDNEGDNGAAGNFKALNDSWVLTDKVKQDAKNDAIDAGHAIIITGYDDNAVITDADNKQHKGVFTIRNSWGASAGDNGNYYMSYDYFTSMVLEAEELLPTK